MASANKSEQHSIELLLPEELEELDDDPDADVDAGMDVDPKTSLPSLLAPRLPSLLAPSLPSKLTILSSRISSASSALAVKRPRSLSNSDQSNRSNVSSGSKTDQSQNQFKRRRKSPPPMSIPLIEPTSETDSPSTLVSPLPFLLNSHSANSETNFRAATNHPSAHMAVTPLVHNEAGIHSGRKKIPLCSSTPSTSLSETRSMKLSGHLLASTTRPASNQTFPSESYGSNQTIDDDDEDVEVQLRGPVDENDFFSPPRKPLTRPDEDIGSPMDVSNRPRNSVHTSSPMHDEDDGYHTWGGISSSDNEDDVHQDSPASSPIATFPSAVALPNYRQSPESRPYHRPRSSLKAKDQLLTLPDPVKESKSSKSIRKTISAAKGSASKSATVHLPASPNRRAPLDPSAPAPNEPGLSPPSAVNGNQTSHIQPNHTALRNSRQAFDAGAQAMPSDPGDQSGQDPTAAQMLPRRNRPRSSGEGELDPLSIREIFSTRGAIPLRNDGGEFGQATPSPSGYEGYSDRSLQIPSGELTDEALDLRWAGISPEDCTRVKDYEDAMHFRLPQACRDIIKGTVRANFDPEVHRWLACRIKVLSEFPERSTEKGDYVNEVVRELFYRFADLHPSNMFLKDEAMEKSYVDKIKSSLRSRASDVKARHQPASGSVQKAMAAFIPFLDRALHRGAPTRPSDLYFEDEGVYEMTKPLWDEHWAELKPQLIESEGSEEAANRYRISSHMGWRSWFFYESGFIPKDVQAEFVKEAEALDKSQGLSASEIFEEGLPLINNILYEFSRRTGIPFMLVMSWLDPENSGQIQTMLQTGRGQASTDISDFRHSSTFVDTELLPRWRSWTSRIFELHDDAPHVMYEHITTDEATGSPQGTVPSVEAYDGAVDLSTEVKTAKARVEVLKYLGDRWCQCNNRQRANHDQIQLDINDKVPKNRLPKAIRSVEIERVLPNGDSVVETVEREVTIPYTKITTMPTPDFVAWLHHLADPEIPAERQFFFSAELRRAHDAGTLAPITVQAALDRRANQDDENTTAAGRPRSRNTQDKGPPKKRASKPKANPSRQSLTKRKSAPIKAKTKSKNVFPDGFSEESEEGEEIVLPGSDDSDDLPERDLATEPTKGNRQSKRIKVKSKGKAPESIDHVERGEPHVTASEDVGRGPSIDSTPQRQCNFLSSVSLVTPIRRLPGVFSLSPPADPLDSATASHIVTSLVKAKSHLQNLPLPDLPCEVEGAKLSPPNTIFDILSLLSLLDFMFPHRPRFEHPAPRTTTLTMEKPDPAVQSAVTEQIWIPLNDPNLAIPKASTLQGLCLPKSRYAQDTFDTAWIFVREAVLVLQDRSLLASGNEIYSATRLFSILCRYIVFIGRNPPLVHHVQPLVDAIAEWGIVLVTVTYAVHTTQAVLLRYPQDHTITRPLTSATAIPSLLSSFLTSLYDYISRRHYAFGHAVRGEFMFLSLEKPPCFSLANPQNRWFSASPSKKIEALLSDLFTNDLAQDPTVFHHISIIGQMELLTVVCALHTWQKREMDEETWITWLQRLRDSILEKDEDNGDQSIRGDAVRDPSSTHPLEQPPSAETPMSDVHLPSAGEFSQQPSPIQPRGQGARSSPEMRGSVKRAAGSSGGGNVVEDGLSSAKRASDFAAAPDDDALPTLISAGPPRWRPGDKASIVINKKSRDVELIRQDGVLQMRDSVTKKVLTDRQKKPKPLPLFDRSLLYDRLPLNAPQKLAKFHLYSQDPPPPPEINDPGTWVPFLPPGEEYDVDVVRSHWGGASSQASSVKGTVIKNGVRKPTRQIIAPKNGAGERVILTSHLKRRSANNELP
ncbi:hypothetical protein M407DRAFT_26760 [Tulasnella calospora MUT 4182]|uniref:Uncharacterized protein n=1 Tax=Tulasnella calospora MUT 4182 TaxID=1051891 RepID=A0A0C3LR36_9AGAM|nr:hypothetical protein M407DRAFT_26760 [Tulasnella calospora MUT 4182]